MAVPLRPTAARAGPVPVISACHEYQPAPAVAQAVACTWQGVSGWPRRMRLLPDGCLDLVWDGRHSRFARPADRPVRRPVGDTALITGIRIRPGWDQVAERVMLATVTDAGISALDPREVRRSQTIQLRARHRRAARQRFPGRVPGYRTGTRRPLAEMTYARRRADSSGYRRRSGPASNGCTSNWPPMATWQVTASSSGPRLISRSGGGSAARRPRRHCPRGRVAADQPP
jgi:Domain of unknown function (DUF6597)